MKVLFINAPDGLPEPVEIRNELKDLQNLVGGYIEAIYPFPDNVAVLLNESGKIFGLPVNRKLIDRESNIIVDVLVGNIVLVGVSGEDFISLTAEQIEKYSIVFGHESKNVSF